MDGTGANVRHSRATKNLVVDRPLNVMHLRALRVLRGHSQLLIIAEH